MKLVPVVGGDENAVSIVSDGTEEGTAVYIGGSKVDGIVSVRWELRPSSNRARVVLEIDKAQLNADMRESVVVRRAVESIQREGG